MRFRILTSVLAALCTLAVTSSAQSATVWNETTNGDLSGNYANPSDVTLASGSNSVFATFGQPDIGDADQDYIHVHIPAGRKLTGLFLQSYVSDDGLAFIAMQAGTEMTFAAHEAFSAYNDILGWTHFGPGEGDSPPGVNILPRMGTNGANFFVPPMPGRDYSFWLQQLTGLTTVQFDFVVSNLVPGDFNLDGSRSSADIRAMLVALTDLDKFVLDNGLSPADLLAIGDLNGADGVTNRDIQSLLNLFASEGSVAPVPEPASAVIGAMMFPVIIGLATRRRVHRSNRRA